MIYLANPTTAGVRAAMVGPARGTLGAITTPDQRNAIPDGATWVADNGLGPGRAGDAAGKGARTDDAWFHWLQTRTWARDDCLFAAAPDVVGDAPATLARSKPWLPQIRDLGYPAALVAQDGLEDLTVPWETFDVLFLGGSIAWKLGPAARQLTGAANQRGIPVHMGRVNSLRRMRYAKTIGCRSVDGTYLAFGPDKNLPKLLRFLEATIATPRLEALIPTEAV